MTTGPASHRYISQRLSLHYVDWGNPEAPPLLLLHGGRDHCRSWDWVAEELRRDWHVIAPDLRGHGDSAWSADGNYPLTSFFYDIAQLVHQLGLAPLTIVAHSLGGIIGLAYAGLYPANVRRLVAIEGLGPSPQMLAEYAAKPKAGQLREWIEHKRAMAGRAPKRYRSLEEAYRRMKDENAYLTDAQARHLTVHGVSQNEDGSYSWKFDNYFRVINPMEIATGYLEQLWQEITCPTLLLYGANSNAARPDGDDRLQKFRNARWKVYDNAGHWPHHDQFDSFVADVREFLLETP